MKKSHKIEKFGALNLIACHFGHDVTGVLHKLRSSNLLRWRSGFNLFKGGQIFFWRYENGILGGSGKRCYQSMNAGFFYRRCIKEYARSELSKSELRYHPQEIREVLGKNFILSRTDNRVSFWGRV